MEISGVTCRMASSSIAVKDNSKICNSRAIYMLLFLFLNGPGMEGTGPKPFFWEKIQAQQRYLFNFIIKNKNKEGLVIIEKYNPKINCQSYY